MLESRMIETRFFDVKSLGQGEDCVGNNAAITCPSEGCGKVYLVSGMMHKKGRECPACGQSKAFATGGKDTGGSVKVQWRAASAGT